MIPYRAAAVKPVCTADGEVRSEKTGPEGCLTVRDQKISKDPPVKPGAFHRPGKALIYQQRLKGVSTATTR